MNGDTKIFPGCFECAHRQGRSRISPELTGCENAGGAFVNWQEKAETGCRWFKQASEWEKRRSRSLDSRDLTSIAQEVWE